MWNLPKPRHHCQLGIILFIIDGNTYNMSGRGCTILIKLFGSTESGSGVEDISLPVAIHSPLLVLKEQLHTLVSIAPVNQVLILCNLLDPDRNSDLLLTGRDHESLRSCGIRNGSVLTLHALGLSAERQQSLTIAAFASPKRLLHHNLNPAHVLSTSISAQEADHRYIQIR
jgi:hypothetical protein